MSDMVLNMPFLNMYNVSENYFISEKYFPMICNGVFDKIISLKAVNLFMM